jgi:hypothetical protein
MEVVGGVGQNQKLSFKMDPLNQGEVMSHSRIPFSEFL